MVKRIFLISVLVFLFLASGSFAENLDMPKPLITRLASPPKAVLLVGNSFLYYNNGVGAYAGKISSEIGVPIKFTMVAIGGAGLDWHLVKTYLRPNGLRSYTPARGGGVLIFHEYPHGKVFDAVILQDNSQGPIHPKLAANFKKYAAIHCADARAAGAEPLIMLTWAYADKPEITENLARATIDVANANKAMVVPVGLAFANASGEDPAIKLIGRDKKHPTPAGTYLEACVIVATLTGKSPQGAKCLGVGEARVTPKEAEFLQKVAWETVRDFFGWQEN